MDPTQESQESVPVWKGEQAPCVYCGQVVSRAEDRCPHCRTSMSVAVRRASRELIGPWYYLDPRNPSGRGVTFEALIKMIEKGRIRHDSIVRGPTTHQDWVYAAEAPRLAKYLGVCPHCFAEAKPEDTYCTHCQLNMNTRPAEPRPGIPWDLVKPPMHRAAYDIERDLSGSVKPSGEMLEGEALDIPVAVPPLPPPPAPAIPVAAPVAAVRAEPTPPPRSLWPEPAPRPVRAEPTPPPRPVAPPARVESAAMLAAAAQLAPIGHSGAGHESPVEAMSALAAERPTSMITLRRPKKKMWAMLLATVVLPVATLGIVAIVLVYSGWLTPATKEKILEQVRVKTPEKDKPTPAVTPTRVANPNEVWLADRTKELEKAVAARDFTKAVEVCEAIRIRTGDASWDARLEDLRRQQTDDRRGHNAKLNERLQSAEELFRNHRYEEAITIVKGIGKEDRAVLAELGVGVDLIERKYREDQIKWDASQQKESQLKVALDQARKLQGAKRNDDALTSLRAIKKGYAEDVDLLQRVVPTLDADIKALETLVASAKPKVDPTKIAPPKLDLAPEQTMAVVADLWKQATDLEAGEKVKEALAKLQEIKTRFDPKFWPEGFDKRYQSVDAKVQALIFFGLGGETPPKKDKNK